MNLNLFTLKQKQNIELGIFHTEKLTNIVKEALDIVELEEKYKRHYIIVGPTGVGKSHTIYNTADIYDIPLKKIISATSMSALTISLACAVYRANGNQIYVWVDDCSSLFENKDSMAVVKNALDMDKNIFAWNKNMTSKIQMHENSRNERDHFIAEALRAYQTVDGVGIEIPVDNVSFIITTNHPLTSPHPEPTTPRGKDEAAIQDRVVYTEFDMSRDLAWGWTAAVILSNKNIFNLNKSQKYILLNWMDNNWDRLRSVSMRAVGDLAQDMINNPKNYPDHWNMKLKKIK